MILISYFFFSKKMKDRKTMIQLILRYGVSSSSRPKSREQRLSNVPKLGETEKVKFQLGTQKVKNVSSTPQYTDTTGFRDESLSPLLQLLASIATPYVPMT